MNRFLLPSIGFLLTLVSSCGAKTKQRVGDVPLVIPGPESAASSRGDGALAQPLGDIRPGFGPSALLGELEKRLTNVAGIAKVDDKVTIFQMTDGSGYAFDESSETLTFLPSVSLGNSSSQTYMTGKNSAWRLSQSKVEYLSAKTPEGGGAAPVFDVLSLDLDFSGFVPVRVSPTQLILKNTSELRIFNHADDEISLSVIKEVPALVSELPAVLAAGFAPDNSFLWAATPSKVLFFGLAGEKLEMMPSVAKLVLGLTGVPKITFLAVHFDNQKKTAGKIFLASEGNLLVSGLASGKSLSWETDIRPIAEQFCVSCHKGSDAAANFFAGDPAAWKGVKRQSVIARVFTLKTMPPVNTAPAKGISQRQREMIRDWLTNDAASTSKSR